ncbi:MAG TPA: DUF885 domain-containing protein [Steroidobacteraceae bacterium]|nr:DUF885 domain-containing protein [Steroidobacteraceae bacterium]
MQRTTRTAALAAAVLLCLAGCGQQQHHPAGPMQKPVSEASRQWRQMADDFIRDYFDAQPFFAAQAGKHEYDGQLPDLSEHGLRREVARLHQAHDNIAKVDPTTLEPNERFDREYLLAVIDRDLFWLEKAHYPNRNPYWYLGQIDPDMYLSRDYAPLDVRMKAYIKYARGMPKMAKDIQDNLKGPLPKTFVELGIADFGGFVDFYKKDVGPVFASVSNPDLQKQLADANTNAANAMANLKDYLVSLRKSANEGYPLGQDLFAEMVKDTERVDVPVGDIEAAGRADLERNTAALKSECSKLLPRGTVAACIAKVMAHRPADPPVEAARKQLGELKQFIEQHDVVTIPNNDPIHVAEAPPYNRSNLAFIQVPGPFDHGVAATYNIAPPDPKWSKAEQAAYIPAVATLLFTSVHEVWPGHFLQFLHSNADTDHVQAIWVGYAYAEGWAHYCEEMMWEEGLGNGDPETHIGQLVEALLRDVRLISAIGLHTHGMTVAQAEKMFREQGYQDPGNARQQAARGTYDPAYLNYTLGKLMIRKLRSDWIAQSKSGKPVSAPASSGAAAPTVAPASPVQGATQPAPVPPPAPAAAPPGNDQALWKSFHDEFLSHGGPPIPLLRKLMLGGDQGAVL